MLVLQIAENFWRLLRARNMETGALSTTLIEQRRQLGVRSDPAGDPELGGQLALAYAKHDKVFSRLGRYETTIERSYYRAVRELNKMQVERRKRGDAEIRSVSQSAESTAPTEIRSVSQSAESAPPIPAPPRTHQPSGALTDAVGTLSERLSDHDAVRLLHEIATAPIPSATPKYQRTTA
jgi:hypothetical protein